MKGSKAATFRPKACALGASSCLIGKAFLYALAANGYDGVRTAIEIIRKELDVSMALTGVTSLKDVDRTILSSAEDSSRGA